MAGIPWGAIAEAVSIIASIATNPEALEQATKAAQSAGKALSTGLEAAGAAAEAAAPVAKKAVQVGSSAANAVSKTASGAIDKGSRVAGAVVGAAKGRRELRDQAKALLDARRQILGSASASFSANQFQEDWNRASAGGILLPLKSAGYFVIATYKGKPGKNDWGKYSEVYVGRSRDMGASVHRHLSGGGNPDVYADMKYGKYLHVFAFPDFDEYADKDETLASFMLALGGGESYNARNMQAIENGAPFIDAVVRTDDVSDTIAAMGKAFSGILLVDQELCGNGATRLLFKQSQAKAFLERGNL